MSNRTPALSVVIPAYNEARHLPQYLPTVLTSLRQWETESGERGEIIVVDNASTDDTGQVARQLGARVIVEPVRNIGQVRNTGAAAAAAPYLLFFDADVAVPAEAVIAVMNQVTSGTCVGGMIPPLYRPTRFGTRILVACWAFYRRIFGGAQGVAQFCSRQAFTQLGGYRSDLFMSEDVEFFARLTRHGKRLGQPVAHLTDLRVEPSNRRFDQWPSWRMIWWANPITAHLFLSSRRFWRHWYESTVR
jgi:glycosyltransferase involved in cell wall biosynthesis